jgi:pimeloyl-ACP methyl ester carboxylesterase
MSERAQLKTAIGAVSELPAPAHATSRFVEVGKFDRRVYLIFERLDAMPCWHHVAVPALLVKGEHSKRVDERVLAQVRLRSPRVDLVEVPKSDHHVTLDDAHGFVEPVRNWLDSQP